MSDYAGERIAKVREITKVVKSLWIIRACISVIYVWRSPCITQSQRQRASRIRKQRGEGHEESNRGDDGSGGDLPDDVRGGIRAERNAES